MKKIGFPPVKTKSYPWKFLRNNPWNKSLSREKSAKIQPVKHKFLGVKKIKRLSPWNWQKSHFFTFFYLFLTRENKIFNPWKNLKKYPWKVWPTREILRKGTREKNFLPVKKTKKTAKKRFHGYFWFSRGKKKNNGFHHPMRPRILTGRLQTDL